MSEKTGADKRPESPTTARELDWDDDNDVSTATSPKHAARPSEEATEVPPPKPPRPMSPMQQAEKTLIEAFPDMDTKLVKAVLVASNGKVEPAFNALLSMSDPNFTSDEAPPPQPPRPQPRAQLQQDEQYARQLAEHYSVQGSQGRPGAGQSRPAPSRAAPGQASDREHSFFDDDLPEIRKTIEQGFKETQQTLSSLWNTGLTSIRKKLDNEADEYDQYGNPTSYPTDNARPPRQPSQHPRQNFGPSQADQLYGIRKSAEQRRSQDHARYDADNRVLGDDFAQLELRDNDGAPAVSHTGSYDMLTTPPGTGPRSSRPHANPDLFKPTPVAPPQSGPVDEVDALYRNPSPSNQPGSQAKSSGKKWQPLTSIAPHPEPHDHDPFSLGDSDDDEAKTKDINPEDSERLKKAAQTKETPSVELKAATRSGSVGQKDAAAEALLRDAK
ncbi:hypothetical protein P153DRAFT_375756 [Dothidotthia symphoricarpi CBS 119687]|uniref:CUE domain-containing protein n=1 Tax=Dothidotthia symphoricarpi CBS 119687 TaxID=1392245 RepID=A0A6A6ABQ7_9PLEO|nr:uncharacterized protein P153DRAFT_375756 [Dothidotthia symphoricarpi CBS 119687]KAF2129230.1 hypothetical protein P153DRAFT_375756 [Dothidotthia symphoricarpi CBS 119687]